MKAVPLLLGVCLLACKFSQGQDQYKPAARPTTAAAAAQARSGVVEEPEARRDEANEELE
jgi:hypothetical protein